MEEKAQEQAQPQPQAGLSPKLCVEYYGREDIQEALVGFSADREIAVRYGESFGRRPDALVYKRDVLESARQGATSFHSSVERWKSPLQLSTAMRKQELDELRKGWDMILDIDCPDFEYSKRIAQVFMAALRELGVTSLCCKFSGNRGFHIGVPFEAFPSSVGGRETQLLFPAAFKAVSGYLSHHISSSPALSDKLRITDLREAAARSGTDYYAITRKVCRDCGATFRGKAESFDHVCPSCGKTVREKDRQSRVCDSCMKFMVSVLVSGNSCARCGSKNTQDILDLSSFAKFDAMLISSRHMFRMPYSLHEKTGLVSLPLRADGLEEFRREDAVPEKAAVRVPFLDRSAAADAASLLESAMEWQAGQMPAEKAYRWAAPSLASAVRGEFFPPCMRLILEGLEDGRKRGMFALLNFLSVTGYSSAETEKLVLEWNQRNKPPLSSAYVTAQLRQSQQKGQRVMPPNCNNLNYYVGIGVCRPDLFCPKIKNPASYAIRKSRMAARESPGRGKG